MEEEIHLVLRPERCRPRDLQRSESIAEGLHRRSIEINPNFVNAYNNRFEALIELREFTLALADADVMVKLAPSAARGHQARGDALRRLNRNNDAVAAYRLSLTLEPADHIRARSQEGLKALKVPQ